MRSVISLGDTMKLGEWNNNNIINNSYIILTKYGQAVLLCFLVCFVFFLLSVVWPTYNVVLVEDFCLLGISKILQQFCWVSYCICLEGLRYWRLQVNSDRSTTRVSFQFFLYVFLSQRENSTLDQDSLTTLSHAHLFFSGSWPHSSESCCHCWSRASSLWLV